MHMDSMRLRTFTILAVLLASLPAGARPSRLKELVDLQGIRENQVLGYGLVVGLPGTGDTEQSLFTSQSLSGMLGRLGIRVDARDIRSRNVAAVMVTAKLPTFTRPGSRTDVQVSSLGNARSLEGGTLLLTPLAGADSVVYAVAQGAVQVGGYQAASTGSSVRKNQPTAGRVPEGATVERAVAPDLGKGPLVLGLKRPDFTTASRIAAAIETSLGEGTAKPLDPASVEVTPPADQKANYVALLAKLEQLEVEADGRARVVVSERTGTVVAGERVTLRPVAVAHGGLRVSIAQTPYISQPNAFASGQTVNSRYAVINSEEAPGKVVALSASGTVDELVRALNAIGATPRDLIAILQAIKAAGALDAELEVI